MIRKAVLGLFLLICSCGDDPQPGVFILETQHTVDGSSLVLNDMRYQNAAGQTYGVNHLVYYLSDVVLHRSDGGQYVIDAALYNDVRNAATLRHRFEGVPPGNYTAMTFTWGLDEEKNVPAGLPDNLENNNMVWPAPLGGGYHYAQCEGFYLNAQGTQAGYATHMGRVRRDVDTEDHHHFFTVNLSIALNVDGNTSTVPIVMDINQWYEDPNIYAFPEVPMIMGDLDRQRMLMENGASVFSIGGR